MVPLARPRHLVQRLRPNDQIMAVRYLTAPVKDDQAALARQRTYLDALSAATAPSKSS